MAQTDIENTDYSYDDSLAVRSKELSDRVIEMRRQGALSPTVLHRIRNHFRIKNIYHSNAIEGNKLGVGETRQVVELGLTITGKSLRDQAEARNLSHALDFLEQLAGDVSRPISESDIRQIHALVMQGIEGDAGKYRSVPVEISGSDFEPPNPEMVASEMERFGSWLSTASIPGASDFATVTGLLTAAVAHTWFVTVHPFVDGNGRVARLLMNLVLMRYGYPIAIILKDDRLRYYDALEDSQSSDLTAFIALLIECVEESLEEYEQAAEEHREQTEWALSLAQKFTHAERVRANNEYEVWRNAMELFKSYIRQTVDIVNDAADFGNVYFKDFGNLEFEKYSTLRQGNSTKRTWFFRIDFRSADSSARYLFFFGHGGRQLRQHCAVTLHMAREEPENSFYYERLTEITATNVPSFVEIGYDMRKEKFVLLTRTGSIRKAQVESFSKQFFEDVVRKHFRN